MINVTKSFMPARSTFDKYVDTIWENKWLTNQGPLVKELERKLIKKFKVKHALVVNNGTIALQISLKSLGFTDGEIITTPFSYVATTSSIVWERFTPVYVDIDPDNLNIDPDKIEAAITEKTRAILAVHVFGIPCPVEKISRIAQKYGLKVIYDAAHSFGMEYKGESITNWGDISTISFHATKLFHTIEGGVIITNDDEIAHKVSYMRNFGHETPTSFYGVGINGKMNEFSAAMGLSIIDSVSTIIKLRKKIVELYDKLFESYSKIRRPTIPVDGYNYSYYPIILPSEKKLLKVMKILASEDIYPRRYFYPSLSRLPYIQSPKMPISEDISSRILCLPLYHDLEIDNINKIVNLIKKVL